jgi:23S rRNA (guanine745-N1)-methyltransferase
MIELRCPVRGCGAAIPAVAALQRPPRRGPGAAVLLGPCGHSFDIARSGYVNLLQPQDRRAKVPGDSPAAIAARRRLLDAGAGTALLEALTAAIAALGLTRGARAVDIGAGEGSLLGALAARLGLEAAGIELSARAADLAARRYPGVLWLVANADRDLPLADGSVDLMLSITARRNPGECARVLAAGGRLVVAVPAPDDLVELREAVLGSASREDRAAKVVEEHRAHFEVCGRLAAREKRRFSPGQLADLLVSTYRGGRSGRLDRLDGRGDLEVTMSQDIVVLAPRRASRGG